jgi:hypothetical protein
MGPAGRVLWGSLLSYLMLIPAGILNGLLNVAVGAPLSRAGLPPAFVVLGQFLLLAANVGVTLALMQRTARAFWRSKGPRPPAEELPGWGRNARRVVAYLGMAFVLPGAMSVALVAGAIISGVAGALTRAPAASTASAVLGLVAVCAFPGCCWVLQRLARKLLRWAGCFAPAELVGAGR